MNIAKYIDHTALKPETTVTNIKQLCAEAIDYGFVAVCIPPYYVPLAKDLLKESNVKVATAVGFPTGYSTSNTKLREIETAIADGAVEIDLVHNIAAVKNADWKYLESEIADCTKLVHESGKTIKIILETGLLTDEEIIKCCQIYAPLKVDFLKTSTGFTSIGATVHAVSIMRSHLPESIAIKASGGIKTFAFAQELIDAGATRLGCSSSIAIVKESKEM